MEAACGVRWRPGCSPLGQVPRGDCLDLSSGASGFSGVRRSVNLTSFSRAPSNSRRASVVIASAKRADKNLQSGPAKVGLAFLAGNLLLECTARAESFQDLLVDAAGGNVSRLITFLCIAEAVALTGAIVGGIIARQRRDEILAINTQLRQINGNLRRQARVESYAPGLMYAPPVNRIGPIIEETVDKEKNKLLGILKSGKKSLREQKPAEAFVEFEKALALAQKLQDPVEEKKAARGLGASLQRQGMFKEAIPYHQLVLSISERTKDNGGNTEAYGAIGDCYSELGELETAAKYYDSYIDLLQNEDVD